MIPPILADLEGIGGIVFFIIAFVGWIMNLSKENEKAQARQKRPPRKRPQGGQNEIDQFLQETKKGERRRPRKPAAQDVLTEDDIEIIEESPRRRPPRQREKTQRSTRERKRVTQSQPKPTPPRQPSLSERSSSGTSRGSKSSISEHVDSALPHAIDANVSSHMGVFTAASASSSGQRGMAKTTRNRKAPAGAVIALMKSKKRIQDAIIVNEVLAKPLSLRK